MKYKSKKIFSRETILKRIFLTHDVVAAKIELTNLKDEDFENIKKMLEKKYKGKLKLHHKKETRLYFPKFFGYFGYNACGTCIVYIFTKGD